MLSNFSSPSGASAALFACSDNATSLFHFNPPSFSNNISSNARLPRGVRGDNARKIAVGAATSYMLQFVLAAAKSSVVSDRMTNTMYGGKLNRYAVEIFVKSSTSSVKFDRTFGLSSSPSMHVLNACLNSSSEITFHEPGPPWV